MQRKAVLSIAGSDCSGGAGIQADIKTILTNGCYAMTVITALTAQNTQCVSDIVPTNSSSLSHQLDSIFEDIIPDAVKIGMICDLEQVQIISAKLKKYYVKKIVIDPVMVSTSGSKLSDEEAINFAKKELYPLASVITPNISEAQVLSDINIDSKKDMEQAALKIYNELGCSVFLKGGHLQVCADDVLCQNGTLIWFNQVRIQNENTHGTGCTLSSAIACYLAKGQDLPTAISNAKSYITQILHSDLNLGYGSGPLDHGYQLSIWE